MSYILDALKRADADRERGHVPGLHSQVDRHAHARRNGNARPPAGGAGRWHRPAVWLVLVGVLLLAAATVWWGWPTPRQMSHPAEPPTAAAQLAQAGTPVEPAARPVAEERHGDPPRPVLPILAPEPPRPSPPAATRTSSPPAARHTPAPRADTMPPPSVSPTPGSTRPADGADPAPVRRFADLPPEVRAQLPAVNINGSTYSQNPAHRMLIANGQVVQEGGEVAPGLKLETIGPRSAVLNHQGTRYSIGY